MLLYEEELDALIEERRQKLFERAYCLAEAVHEQQLDKGGMPYFDHPLRVANRFRGDLLLMTAAILHDTVEDSPLTLLDIRETFGTEIAQMVDGLTRRKDEIYAEYVNRAAKSKETRWIKMADLLDNLDESRLAKKTDKDRQRMDRYLDSLAFLMKRCKEEEEIPLFSDEVQSVLERRPKGYLEINILENEKFYWAEEQYRFGVYETNTEAFVAAMNLLKAEIPKHLFGETEQDLWDRWHQFGVDILEGRREGIPKIGDFSAGGYAITLIKRLCGGVSEDSLKLGFESAMGKIEADKKGMSQVSRQRFLSGFEALEPKLERKGEANLLKDSQLGIQFER